MGWQWLSLKIIAIFSPPAKDILPLLSNVRSCAAKTPDSLPENFLGLPVIGIQFMSEMLPRWHFSLFHCEGWGRTFSSPSRCRPHTRAADEVTAALNSRHSTSSSFVHYGGPGNKDDTRVSFNLCRASLRQIPWVWPVCLYPTQGAA